MRLRLRLRRRRPPDRFEAVVHGNVVTLLHDGAACFPAMLEAIAAAREEVLFEMYWFGSDRTGRRFADALMERARAGVDVRVIYDAVGSLEAEDALFDAMRAAGCQVHEYNPIAPWRQRFDLGLVNNRDHRKIIVVDRKVAFTGGLNVGDPWAPEDEGGEGWRDDMVRIEGPAALQMRRVFFETWAELHPRERTSVPEAAPAPAFVPEAGTPVRVLANHYRAERELIRKTYLGRIERASSHVYIVNSYFIPDRMVRRALARACARGVDIQVLLPGQSDLRPVQYAGRRLYDWLLRAGVTLYEWDQSILHAKTAVVDDTWCTLGTFNIDHRSWRNNLEVNVAIESPAVARALAERFRSDAARSVRIDREDWRYRPLSQRVLEQFFYLFRKLL